MLDDCYFSVMLNGLWFKSKATLNYQPWVSSKKLLTVLVTICIVIGTYCIVKEHDVILIYLGFCACIVLYGITCSSRTSTSLQSCR